MRERKQFDRSIAVIAWLYAETRARYEGSEWWRAKADAIDAIIRLHDLRRRRKAEPLIDADSR